MYKYSKQKHLITIKNVKIDEIYKRIVFFSK